TLKSEFLESGPFITIGGLVVDRNHRRAGIGRTLMRSAETWAKAQGGSVVRLSSSSTRSEAHKFYESLGYTNVQTQFAFVKSADLSEPAEVRQHFVPNVNE